MMPECGLPLLASLLLLLLQLLAVGNPALLAGSAETALLPPLLCCCCCRIRLMHLDAAACACSRSDDRCVLAEGRWRGVVQCRSVVAEGGGGGSAECALHDRS